MRPFLIAAVLYLTLAGVSALVSSVQAFELFPFFSGLRWLSVHLITLGALTEAVFGVLPWLTARLAGRGKPRTRWDIWILLNAGLLLLIVGIPPVNYPLIVSGGMLVFTAALLVLGALGILQQLPNASHKRNASQGRYFYLAGLSFLLLGITVGSGLWFGWGRAQRIANPLEVHIHSNIWGFMSLIFAGFIIDLYQRWTGYELPQPGSNLCIFWLMTLGGLGSVLGPWLALNQITALGILLHQAATAWLLLKMIRPLIGTEAFRKPGIWHVLTSYAWQLVIVLSAPLFFLFLPGVSAAGIEQTAPLVLIYGWMLQFGYAVVPYFLRRAVSPNEEAGLGGSWFSLAAVHLGGIFLLASIVVSGIGNQLLGVAFLLWFLSVLPAVKEIVGILNTRVGHDRKVEL